MSLRAPESCSPEAHTPAAPERDSLSVVVEIALVHPGHLDGLENLLTAVLRVVVEAGQLLHPALEIGEDDRPRIDVRMFFGERERDVARVNPLHGSGVSTCFLWRN